MVKYSDGLDAVAGALAHAGRRQLIGTLQRGPATSSQLAAELGIGLPALHKHLVVLAGAELIASHKAGRVVTHRLRRGPLLRYDDWLAARAGFWHDRLDALAESLGATAEEEPGCPSH